MQYAAGFKNKMIEKMLGPDGRSLSVLANECGVAPSTLWKWRHEAKEKTVGKQKRGSKKRWRPSERLRIVKAAAPLAGEDLGAFLRREGLHEADLERFRADVLEAATRGFEMERKGRGLSPEQKEIRVLKRELRRKERALAETAALLVLRGKMRAFLSGDEEGDIDERNGS
mgnify:CR=1 FL=1